MLSSCTWRFHVVVGARSGLLKGSKAGASSVVEKLKFGDGGCVLK